MALRIATLNVNGVRVRAPLLERLVASRPIDILCLQETKCANAEFPANLFRRLGFPHLVVHGQRMHHGVAIASRTPIEEVGREDWQANGEARHLAVRLPSGVVLHNVYVPAGGDVPDPMLNPKFGQKLDFLARMTDWSARQTEPAILVGDLNIAPLPEDVWDHEALLEVVSHTPVEVDALETLRASHGWVDLARRFVPAPQRLYTWWSYRARDWAASDRGRRLDHVWCSPALAATALGVETLREARGWERPSDHVPVIATFDL
ncbi:MAG: exodeoxyribonuclease III [Sphingomonadaceae bacterium]|uniref:exodeoxyribonuclease III n=1 Tax=Thermaurantiacus sp. TaxID=2820283 RepID=UPI00298F2702|nr:exodeoxyribonuclease III [Thermaurantiacus sp.]MCS6987328.1 exodeoxyribonuclease III [Sphingomonadaceae bacterium]MDW8414549.1 exodeoxyribonuclease III [Thermaurantiacus sp.]